MPPPVRRVAIVGGGVGGLALATALRRADIAVDVFERAARFVPTVGAGFGFGPNGQACLASLGLRDAIRPILHPFMGARLLSVQGKEKFYMPHALQPLQQKYGYTIAGTLRADLIDVLAAPLLRDRVLHYNKEAVKVDQTADAATVHFSDGAAHTADLVVGADGINSTVARAIFAPGALDAPVHNGENIFYGVIDDPRSLAGCDNSWAPHTITQCLGLGEFIAFPVGGGDAFKLVWAQTYQSPSIPQAEEWGADAQPHSSLATLMDRKRFPNTHPARALHGATDPARILHFPLWYRNPKTRWHSGRVCLLGDACHATLPYVGQGAMQAIEDAVVLAQEVQRPSAPSLDAALSEYYQRRFQRTKHVVDLARTIGRLMHAEGWLTGLLRDPFIAFLWTSGLFGRMAEKEIVQNCPVPIPPLK
mmetsp:Transcript_9501/g.23781  ORF Transcript_9501/g.23781 Transcript_9501/m.23781 type:complete len:420 (-) Transcript_9501:78-1337(-)